MTVPSESVTSKPFIVMSFTPPFSGEMMKQYSKSEIAALTDMNVSLSALFHDIRWLLDIREKLCPISTVFTVVRGERRGWDTMFYPENGHGIEEVYIKKVLKNARNIDTLKEAVKTVYKVLRNF